MAAKKKPSTPRKTSVKSKSAEAMALSGYSGANWSLNRAQIFWPSLDTRDELDTFSHNEIISRVRWLYANVGFIKGFVINSAALVGSLRAQSKALDNTWAAQAEAAFLQRTGSAMSFDRSGKFNFRTAQLMLTRQALRDGDVLTVLTESKSGGAMFAFYEAHQLKAPSDTKDFRAGVRLDPEDRHVEYGLFREGQAVTKVDANRCIYFGEFASAGNRRAYPPLAHAVNHALDITETWANVKAAIKAASLFGVVRERESAATTKSRDGMPGTLARGTNPSAEGALDVASVWGAGQIPEMPAGHKMRILHDDRPSPNQMEFVNTLQTDIACGFGLPLEVIWKISNLTGPGVRFVMEVASRWISLRQDALEDWCRRVWIYVIAKEMKAGRLPYPPEGIEWWNVDFVPERDITIDQGRVGRQKMEEVRSGMSTFSQYHREQGRDWQESAIQRVREEKFHRDLCEKEGVDYHSVFPPAPGSAIIPPAAQSTEPDPAP
jgi:capsid protein